MSIYKITFYVPASHVELVKDALFAAGAGKIGDYDCCAWQVKGQGQFRALAGSYPFLGEQGILEVVEEFRVEMVCNKKAIKTAIAALKDTHPFEEPAYDVVQHIDVAEL